VTAVKRDAAALDCAGIATHLDPSQSTKIAVSADRLENLNALPRLSLRSNVERS